MSESRICAFSTCGLRFPVRTAHPEQKFHSHACAAKHGRERAKQLSRKTWPPDGDFRLPPASRGLSSRSWWLDADRSAFQQKLTEELPRMQTARFAGIDLGLRHWDY